MPDQMDAAPSIEHVRALARKNSRKLAEVSRALVNPKRMTLREYMSFCEDDDYSEEELRQIAGDFLNAEHERRNGDPAEAGVMSEETRRMFSQIATLCAAAVGEDRAEDREFLLGGGWLYLRMLDQEG